MMGAVWKSENKLVWSLMALLTLLSGFLLCTFNNENFGSNGKTGILHYLSNFTSECPIMLQQCKEQVEDLEIAVKTGVYSPIWHASEENNTDCSQSNFTPFSLRRSNYDESTRLCSWQTLSAETQGEWVPRIGNVTFLGCPFVKGPYNCSARGYQHSHRWEMSNNCTMMPQMTLENLFSFTNTRINILIHGDSLLRELFETMNCQFQSQILSYKTFGSRGDDAAQTIFQNLNVVYVFRDYNGTQVMEILGSEGIRFGTLTNSEPNAINLMLTNYGIPHVEYLVNTVFQWTTPAIAYMSHACGRASDVQYNLGYVNHVRAIGRPILDLCTMSIPDNYNTRSQFKGIGDPHLCIPGPHLDSLNIFLHMVVSLVHQNAQF